MATIDTKIDKLTALEPTLKLCEDFLLGGNRVLSEDYIPKGKNEENQTYETRIKSTEFFNFYSMIIRSLVGQITKEEPILNNLDKIDLTNLDSKNSNLTSFIKEVCLYSIVDGLIFVSSQTNQITKNVYFKIHRYIDLYSYYFENNVLQQIVFKETVEVPTEPFSLENQERYTVFRAGGGEVWWDSGNGIVKQEEWTNNLPEIPVVPVQTGNQISQFEVTPPLADVAETNKVLLNLSSQLTGLTNMMANPTTVGWGDFSDKAKNKLGQRFILIFNDKRKEGLEYLEIKGYGVDKLQLRLDKMLQNLDKISFFMFVNDNSKTIIDAQQKQSKNTAFLSDVATEIQGKINIMLRHKAMLGGINFPDDASVELKKEFSGLTLTDPQNKHLKDMVNEGNLSLTTYLTILKSANVLGKKFDVEKELLLLQAQP